MSALVGCGGHVVCGFVAPGFVGEKGWVYWLLKVLVLSPITNKATLGQVAK